MPERADLDWRWVLAMSRQPVRVCLKCGCSAGCHWKTQAQRRERLLSLLECGLRWGLTRSFAGEPGEEAAICGRTGEGGSKAARSAAAEGQRRTGQERAAA